MSYKDETTKGDPRPNGWIHPLDRRNDWCLSEHEDAQNDLNAYLEHKSR